MDQEALQTLNNLRRHFAEPTPTAYPAISKCSIGVEVEVKWRDYFPDLWDKIEAAGGFAKLKHEHADLLKSITDECTEREKVLLPLLEKVTELGVPKGNDRYWEFALDPTYDVGITIQTLKLLLKRCVIPAARHSFHITIADLKLTRHVYHMLMILELLYCSKERIMAGFNVSNVKLSGSWSRKGYAGIFEKDEKDLKCGAKTAVELRTLEIGPTAQHIEAMLETTVELVNAIYDIQQNDYTDRAHAFIKMSNYMTDALKHVGLPDENWKKPHMNPYSWNKFITHFDTLKIHTEAFYDEFMGDIGLV